MAGDAMFGTGTDGRYICRVKSSSSGVGAGVTAAAPASGRITGWSLVASSSRSSSGAVVPRTGVGGMASGRREIGGTLGAGSRAIGRTEDPTSIRTGETGLTTGGRSTKPSKAAANSGMSPSRTQLRPVRETLSCGWSRPSSIHSRSVLRLGAENLVPSVVSTCQGTGLGGEVSTRNTFLQTEQRTAMPSSPICRASRPNSVPHWPQRTITLGLRSARGREAGSRFGERCGRGQGAWKPR